MSGFLSQQRNPIRQVNRDIKRINAEKTMAFSFAIEKGARRIIKAASRVPIPETETGRRVIRPVTVTTIERYKKGISRLSDFDRRYVMK